MFQCLPFIHLNSPPITFLSHSVSPNLLSLLLLSLSPGVVGICAPPVQGDWLRGILLHDRRGGSGPVGEEDCRHDNLHRPAEPRETCTGKAMTQKDLAPI